MLLYFFIYFLREVKLALRFFLLLERKGRLFLSNCSVLKLNPPLPLEILYRVPIFAPALNSLRADILCVLPPLKLTVFLGVLPALNCFPHEEQSVHLLGI